MRILSIDTTSEHGSIALVEDARVVEETALHSPDGFGHVLFPAIQTLLARHGWTFPSLTGIAAGAGPGSFTGVRVGLTAALGLAEVNSIGIAAVSNLRALAYYGTHDVRAPFFDARRNEIYAGLYDAKLNALEPEHVGKFNAWLDTLAPNAELIGFEPVDGRDVTIAPRALAGAIALIGAQELKNPIEIEANYVRRSDAELNWRDPVDARR